MGLGILLPYYRMCTRGSENMSMSGYLSGVGAILKAWWSLVMGPSLARVRTSSVPNYLVIKLNYANPVAQE